jgi:hypothetical protein
VLFGIGTASGQEASSGLEYFSESMNHCRVTSAVALLGLAAFSGGMLYAVGKYPSEYDWHYTPISNLLTPARDLGGYLWASGGIVLCGLCGLCWAWDLRRRRSGAVSPRGVLALQLGCLCMAGSAVPSHSLLGLRKGHEMVTLLAFVSLPRSC